MSCRYWVRKKNEPNIAKEARVIARLAAEKRGLRKSRMSSIGARARSSQATNPASSAAATAKAARMVRSVQPCAGTSMIA